MLGLLRLCGAKHCNPSSRIFSRTNLLAAFPSSLGSRTAIASPSVNFFIAFNINTNNTHAIYISQDQTQWITWTDSMNQTSGHFPLEKFRRITWIDSMKTAWKVLQSSYNFQEYLFKVEELSMESCQIVMWLDWTRSLQIYLSTARQEVLTLN